LLCGIKEKLVEVYVPPERVFAYDLAVSGDVEGV
jgi:hypothetical protein